MFNNLRQVKGNSNKQDFSMKVFLDYSMKNKDKFILFCSV